MADLEKIVDSIDIPKQILDKSESILKTLFGPSFEEIGGMIGDQVKLRRFKNQIKIFTKAQGYLKDGNFNPKKVSLKVLAPLIEYSSYEEEEDLQEKWAKLTSNILSGNQETVFHQNCISILNKISSEEVVLIDELHVELLKNIKENYDRNLFRWSQRDLFNENYIPKIENYVLANHVFHISNLSTKKETDKANLNFMISNLISLGLLKWETDVIVEARKADNDPTDDSIEVDVIVNNNDGFVFTPTGDKFVRICK